MSKKKEKKARKEKKLLKALPEKQIDETNDLVDLNDDTEPNDDTVLRTSDDECCKQAVDCCDHNPKVQLTASIEPLDRKVAIEIEYPKGKRPRLVFSVVENGIVIDSVTFKKIRDKDVAEFERFRHSL